MINLLPPQQKKELLNQVHLRLVLILGILFLSFLISLFLVLFLIRIYVDIDLAEQKIVLQEKENIISLNKKLEKDIIESNTFLFNLNSFYQEKSDLTQILEKIDETLPPGTYLENLSIGLSTVEKEKRVQISLSGYCPTRDKLLELKENLEKDFADVYFSPKSWIEPTEIDFSVVFKLIQ